MIYKGKRLVVIGGTGYVGSAICKHASRMGIHPVSVSRRGGASTESFTSVKGDSMAPDAFIEELRKADGVVHTVGTLIDTSITKSKQPGEAGTYEQMNYETAKRIADALDSLSLNKKMVYISACASPPLIPRYLSNKLRAEAYISSLKNIRCTSLRPGFIYSREDRPWSIPLKYVLDLETFVYDTTMPHIPESSFKSILRNNLYAGPPVSLDEVALSAIFNAFNDTFDGKALEKRDIVNSSRLIRP